MKISFPVLCLIWLLPILGCKSNTNNEVVVSTDESVLPEGFDEFYNQFHTDSVFQLDHIVFPLSGMSSDIVGFKTKWTKDQWIIHKPYNDFNGTHQRSFESMGNLITETIDSSNGLVSMMRRFAKMNGEWNLIFYKQMGVYTAEE